MDTMWQYFTMPKRFLQIFWKKKENVFHKFIFFVCKIKSADCKSVVVCTKLVIVYYLFYVYFSRNMNI